MHDLTIVFHDAGGGHRSAAGALKTVLETAVSSLERNPAEPAGTAGADRLCPPGHGPANSGWLQPASQERLDAAHAAVARPCFSAPSSCITRASFAFCGSYWAQNPTDLVLSVIPHFNRCLAQSIRHEMPNAAFVTLLTDLADYPPNFWIVPESEFIICGSQRAKAAGACHGTSQGTGLSRPPG